LAETLDNISYRVIGLGFPLLTIGIIAGAVWANEAWGSYWSWDPKETWALITWLVFAAYLHARITRGWQGRKPAILAASGFVVVWVFLVICVSYNFFAILRPIIKAARVTK
jgi:cytochrome c-type biogenesis protein CcsB